MRYWLALVIMFTPALAHGERYTFGFEYARRSELNPRWWWVPNGVNNRVRVSPRLHVEITASGFRTDERKADDLVLTASMRNLMSFGAGLSVRLVGPLYVVGGGGFAWEQLAERYTRLADSDWVEVDSRVRPQLFSGTGASWNIIELPKGHLTLGIDVRAYALFGESAGNMPGVPEIRRFTMQGSVILGLISQ